MDEPVARPTRHRDLTRFRTLRFLLPHVAAPAVFAAVYVALTDLTFTVVNVLAAFLTVLLVVGSYTLPASSIRRHGILRGLLSASVTGALVGALFGLLGTGVPPRGSEETVAFASWLLVGLCAPAFSWGAVRTFRILARLPRNIWVLLARLVRPRSVADRNRSTERHPASGRRTSSGRTTDPVSRSSHRTQPPRKKRKKRTKKRRS